MPRPRSQNPVSIEKRTARKPSAAPAAATKNASETRQSAGINGNVPHMSTSENTHGSAAPAVSRGVARTASKSGVATKSKAGDSRANTQQKPMEAAVDNPRQKRAPQRASRKNGANGSDEHVDVSGVAPEHEVQTGDSLTDAEIGGANASEGILASGSATAPGGEFERLFRQWKSGGDERLRERLILMNRNLVSYIARKFTDRGEMSEDIIQQGLIGLINALDHFDPNRGVRFATFATPTIMGEIRRYFRDKTWGIRVPRRLQELNQTINHRIETLTQELDRSPTYAEIARALSLQIEEVVEALEMVHAMDPLSIDEEASWSSEQAPTSVGDQIGASDSDLEGWGDYATLQAALEKLPPKERQVLQMAYFEEWSQVEIARHMQVSQMFISRLQRRALANLRDLMNGAE